MDRHAPKAGAIHPLLIPAFAQISTPFFPDNRCGGQFEVRTIQIPGLSEISDILRPLCLGRYKGGDITPFPSA